MTNEEIDAEIQRDLADEPSPSALDAALSELGISHAPGRIAGTRTLTDDESGTVLGDYDAAEAWALVHISRYWKGVKR